MGVCNRQPLAKSKGVHREVESEGSWRQTFEPADRNCIEGRVMLPNKQKPVYCTGYYYVTAGAT